jgi:hypothetical protein
MKYQYLQKSCRTNGNDYSKVYMGKFLSIANSFIAISHLSEEKKLIQIFAEITQQKINPLQSLTAGTSLAAFQCGQ